MRKKGWIQIGLLFNALLLFTSGAVSQSREARYAYFFNASDYIKVEVSTQRTVAHGSLYDYGALSELLPQSVKEGGPPDLLHYDPNTGRCYFIAVQPETWVGGHGRYNPRIIVVELPDFKLVRRMDLDQFMVYGIHTLLTPDGKRLFISYDLSHTDEKNFVFVREVYDTQSFKLLETKKAVVPRDQYTPEAGLGIRFSDKAWISEDGETIYDIPYGSISARPPAFGGSEYIITSRSITERRRPDWPTSVEDFRAKNPDFDVSWSSRSPARVVLIKTTDREYTYWERDRETGDLRPTQSKTTTKYTNGHLAYYDETTGGRVRELQIQQLAGFMPYVPAVIPDGRIAYFAKMTEKSQSELYAVDLSHEKAVKIEFFGKTPGRCIFADR